MKIVSKENLLTEKQTNGKYLSLKGVNIMPFRNPDRLKKKKDITKEVIKDPKATTKKVHF